VRRIVVVIRLIGMRGDERVQEGMFSYVSLEQRVPADHPLREVRKLTDTVLGSLSRELDALYADSGRPSIAPEYILRALLLQVFAQSRQISTRQKSKSPLNPPRRSEFQQVPRDQHAELAD
jgi:hypothetical protein